MRQKLQHLKKYLQQIQVKSPRIKFVKLINIFVLVALFMRLTAIHHVYSADYVAFVQKTEEKFIVKKAQTRGSIYDRNGLELVTNTPVFSVVYRYDAKRSEAEIFRIATQLAEMLDVNIKNLGNYELKSLYQRLHPKIDWSSITDNELVTLTDANKGAHVIFNKMTEAYYGGENTLKFAANDIEVARVIENIGRLPGIEVVTQSQRNYPEDLGHYDIVGRVSKGDANFPGNDFARYMAAGYSVNDQVGLSSIERQYEDYLRGHKTLHEVNASGMVTELFAGVPGADLTLTIDTVLSDKIDDILEKRIMDAKNSRPAARYLREAYVVLVDPNNGEILSLNGKILTDGGEFIDHSLGTMHNSFTMGSVVKGATLLTGYEHGVTNFGDFVDDKPMIFADDSKKGSWTKLGLINDIQALRSSSNVYFMQQAIRMGGDYYFPKKNLNIAPTTIDKYRDSFAQYGLGVQTGIDLPGEQSGLKNPDRSTAKLLDFVIGQSDTYTTLQLANYVATIANGGNRYALQLLKEASVSLNDDEKILFYSAEPNLLNKVDLPTEAFRRVQEGFRQALQVEGGTGYQVFRNAVNKPAGKTGTAEEFARDAEGKILFDWRGQVIEVNHITFVGYAPFENPEIAIAVVFPQAELPNGKNPIAIETANEIINLYFKMKAQNAKN